MAAKSGRRAQVSTAEIWRWTPLFSQGSLSERLKCQSKEEEAQGKQQDRMEERIRRRILDRGGET